MDLGFCARIFFGRRNAETHICLYRPFIDGSKRAELGACLVFLDINGILPDEAITTKNNGAWEQLVLDVTAGKTDRNQTTKHLGSLLKPGRE